MSPQVLGEMRHCRLQCPTRAVEGVARSLGIDLPAIADLPESERVEFDRHASRLTAAGLRVTALVMFGLTLLAWPTDLLVFEPGSSALAAIARWRLWVLGAAVSGYVVLRSARMRMIDPYLVGLLFIGLPSAASGYLMGTIGGLDAPTSYGVYTIPLFTVLLIVGLPARVAATLLFVAAYFVHFAIADPTTLEDPRIGTPLVWSLAACTTAVVVGHVVYLLLRANWFQKRRLDTFAGELEARVAAQTDEIRDLASRISAVQEQERARIARDLHDELGQQLVGLDMELQLMQRQAGRTGEPPTNTGLANARSQIGALHDALRGVLESLRPLALDQAGFASALDGMVRRMADRYGFAARVAIDIDPDSLSPPAALVLFRIVQEAVTNVARHAGARAVEVRLGSAGADVVLSVEDDGAGFDPELVREKGRMGLAGIAERARLLNGAFALTSEPGHGSRLEIRFPKERQTGGSDR